MGNVIRSMSGRPGASADARDDTFKGGKDPLQRMLKALPTLTCVCGGCFRRVSPAPEGDLVVLQDYPSAEVSEPIYRIGEKLKLVAQ